MRKPSRLYSQNFEDLYLYRLFAHVDNGFYVDGGAWHPTRDSVTAIFYEQGWSGVNIDGLHEAIEMFRQERPRDINLCLGLVENLSITSVNITVLGESPLDCGQHFVSDKLTNIDCVTRFGKYQNRQIAASTLREIIDRYCPASGVDFLKLDIEGGEFKALTGLELETLSDKRKPRVILLEATLPDTRLSAPHRSICRRHLSENGYSHLFFDGLNDYFCRTDLHEDFRDKMLPPNVFDHFPVLPGPVWEEIARHEECKIQLADRSEAARKAHHDWSDAMEKISLLEQDNTNLLQKLDYLQNKIIALEERLRKFQQLPDDDYCISQKRENDLPNLTQGQARLATAVRRLRSIARSPSA